LARIVGADADPSPQEEQEVHVLYVHRNFPAQFGHIAAHLHEHHGFRCTFVSELPNAHINGIRRIQYQTQGAANEKTHYCSRAFENFTWHSHGVFEAMRAHPEIKPDLVVGHSGFGSTLFLRELYDCPIINFFEWYYRHDGSDSEFLRPFPKSGSQLDTLRSRTRDAMMLSDLQACTLGYSPTNWQRSRFPHEYQSKIETIFDGIDTTFWRPLGQRPGKIGEHVIPADKKIITYVSRGFETMRGFDVFLRVAQRICELRDDVVFLCIGDDSSHYADDSKRTGGKSLREHLMQQGEFDIRQPPAIAYLSSCVRVACVGMV